MALFDRIKRLWSRSPTRSDVRSAPAPPVAPPGTRPHPPTAAAPSPERTPRPQPPASAHSSPTLKAQKPSREPTPSPKPTLKRQAAPEVRIDADAVLRTLPDLQRLRSARSEDPESRANDGYQLLEALRDRVGGMLLLTATPMQLHDYELYSMIELVEPGLFNG
jgi:hypothetical protein